MKKQPVILAILDGFGLGYDKDKSAILKAKTPFIDSLFKSYPSNQLGASGEDVGLPAGQMGNSEVGHLNIGSGRIIYQELSRIGNEIREGDFFKNPSLVNNIEKAVESDGIVHILGLISDGGVHSHLDHCKALLKLSKDLGAKEAVVHCFLDGRDVPPKSAATYLRDLASFMDENSFGTIGTIAGRYYAMDRDNRWERIEKAYTNMTDGLVLVEDTWEIALQKAYDREETDEFVLPTRIASSRLIADKDTVIMINFRPDRAREITRAFVDDDFKGFNRDRKLNINYVTMTQYDKEIKNVSVAYPPEEIADTLGEVVSRNDLKQLRIAETEKYAHVTFFFNGGKEDKYEGEDRILVPSPKVATYDLLPEMSGNEVTERLVEAMEAYDLVILNFANPDMVGHTGNMEATIKAIESVDGFLNKIVHRLLELNGQMLLTADHGNADVMLDEDNRVVTSHSLNPVPIIYIGNEKKIFRDKGILADIAPTILELLKIEKPEKMTGKTLFK